MIESMRCSECGSFYTAEGQRSKEYQTAIRFVKKGSLWQPICSDKEECGIRKKNKEPQEFWFNKRIRRRKRRK